MTSRRLRSRSRLRRPPSDSLAGPSEWPDGDDDGNASNDDVNGIGLSSAPSGLTVGHAAKAKAEGLGTGPGTGSNRQKPEYVFRSGSDSESSQ